MSFVQRFSLAGLFCLLSGPAIAGLSEESITNQLPNPAFLGSTGTLVVNATGEVPTFWRGFAVTDATATFSIEQVAADELFPGSLPTRAVRFTVTDFGTQGVGNAGFDNSPIRFSLIAGRDYAGSFYLRTGNADLAPQNGFGDVPIFDESGAFTGSSEQFNFTATDQWQQFSSASFSTALEGASAELALRLLEGSSDNSILIALPQVEGPAMTNRVPNSGFVGTGGNSIENVTGDVPDFWRAFGLDATGDSIELETVPLAADELYPGSPPTNAIKITTSTIQAGFDHADFPLALTPGGRFHWAEVFLRSANMDDSPQGVNIGLGLFDGTNVLPNPGNINPTVDSNWNYYGGIPFSAPAGTTTEFGFRLFESGAENSIMIALPRINGLTDGLFQDGFEEPVPPNR